MEKRQRIIGAVLLGVLPLLFCVVYCAVYGKTLGDIYLPNSYWNDELYYYKQVEGVLHGGVPGGYFGFNESHARVFSFAVWSPLLMLHWVIWGTLFGWNLFSPVVCNLVCLTGAFVLFGWLARPGKKQIFSLAVLLALFTPFTRFIMSCMPETFCCALLLWYMGCLFAYEREHRTAYLWQMHLLAGLLTLMRPYFLLFLLYPVLRFRRHGRGRFLGAVGSGGLFLLGYLALKKYLSADYLFDIMEMPFLQSFREQGLLSGIRALWNQVWESALALKEFLRAALDYGNFPGSMYAVYGCMGVLFVAVLVIEWKRRRESFCFRLALWLAAAYAAMMAAIVLIYSMNEGGRHLMTFILVGILTLGMYSARVADKLLQLLLAGLLGFFFLIQPGIPYDRLAPFEESGLSGEISAMSLALQEKMEISSRVGWENTVIWLAYDIVGEETVPEQWQQLYALPPGCGINYCSQWYVLENIDNLQARYIAAVPGGQVEEALLARGAVLLEKNEKIAVYEYNCAGRNKE